VLKFNHSYYLILDTLYKKQQFVKRENIFTQKNSTIRYEREIHNSIAKINVSVQVVNDC